MIQRIQSVYLAIVMILLSIVTFSTTFFSFVNESSRFSFSAFGITEYDLQTGESLGHKGFPIYIALIALILLAFVTFMRYKRLAQQLRLGRLLFFTYLIFVIGMIILSVTGNGLLDASADKREMGLGFFLFVAGFPFSFMANLGIKRDKNLLDSVDRLR